LIGVALQSSGQTETSLAFFQRAARLQPKNAEFQYNLGKALRGVERLDEARACYEAALRLQPAYPEALNNLSEVLILLEKPEEALASTEKALRLKPEYAEALSNRGGALLALDRPQEALDCLDRALEANSSMPKALNNKTQALAKLRRFDDALAYANRTLALYPDSPEAYFTRGVVLSEMRRLHDAIDDLNHAIAIKPDYPLALISRGAALFHTDQYDAAQRDFEAVIRIGKTATELISRAHLSLGTMLLLNGQFEQGWPEFAWRWGTSDFKGALPGFKQPRWDGLPTSGHVLAWREQGIGDQILYASMLEEAASRAGHFTVAAEQRLHPLLKRSFPGCHLTTVEHALESDAFDFQLSLGDLGTFLRRSVDDCMQNRKAYLKADTNRSGELRRELLNAGGGRLCGLSWSSKHNTVGDRKSIALAKLAPLLSVADYQFVDLQYGDTSEERAHVSGASGVQVTRVESVDNFHDIDGLAALIDACDVIVTISNTTAHLAGALGKLVFLMLPHSVGRFWWWQAGRSDSLWYPDVRIFRQPKEGDWASVIGEVRDALAALPRPDGA
jgi:tetratricopeptide (TPR) repeat protein